MSARDIPVTFLAGYLGAGKTTLLNGLLAGATSRITVMVNDFGELNIDASLIAEHDGSTMVLSNGCVCCTISDGFGEAIDTVRGMSASGNGPDHVVVELSGVAQPARMAQWAVLPGFVPAGTVTVVDAESVRDTAARRYVGETVLAQIVAADLVVLTKTDLTADGGADAREFVADVLSGRDVPVVDVRHVDPVLLLSMDTPAVRADRVTGAHANPHSSSLVTVSGLTRTELEEMVSSLPSSVVRAKGIVGCTDVDAPIEVQVTGRRRTLTERPDLAGRTFTDGLVVISVS